MTNQKEQNAAFILFDCKDRLECDACPFKDKDKNFCKLGYVIHKDLHQFARIFNTLPDMKRACINDHPKQYEIVKKYFGVMLK